MIRAPTLLRDLQRLLKTLEDDLRVRIADNPAPRDTLRSEWRAAREAGRSGESFEAWLETLITRRMFCSRVTTAISGF